MTIKLGFLISLAILALVISLLHAFDYVNFGYVPLPDLPENYGRLVSDMVHENGNQQRRWIITSISFMVFLASGVFVALYIKREAAEAKTDKN